MAKDKKISIDITNAVYDKVMQYAAATKIYKFGPCINYIIAEYFKMLEEKNSK